MGAGATVAFREHNAMAWALEHFGPDHRMQVPPSVVVV